MNNVRTRIAPSPTGENLHIGNVYTGLLNFAFAKKYNGKFIIRIEDTDRIRYVEGSEERILASLKTLHLDYDEGPDIGGPYSPYRQSERLETYHTYAEELIAKGHAEYAYYPKEGSGQKKDYTTEKNLKPVVVVATEAPPKNIAEMIKRGDWVVRMKIPQNEKIIVPDVIRGDIEFESGQLSAQVLIKSDGYPTYHMGVVVDDRLMKITHIIRAEEWISSTPKHILLYRYFGWELPVFAHVPLLRNSDKSKLSKRKSPVWVSWYLEEGYLPEAILNYLALLGWSHPQEKEIFTLAEFISLFDLKDINPVAPIFDLRKLEWMNGKYIQEKSNEELYNLLIIRVSWLKDVEKSKVFVIIDLAKTRMKTLKEFEELVKPFYIYSKEPLNSSEKTVQRKLYNKLSQVEQWDNDTLFVEIKEVMQEEKIKFPLIYKVVTGFSTGLPIPAMFEIIGKEETLKILSR